MTKLEYRTPSAQEHHYTLSRKEDCTNPRIIHENLCYGGKQQEFFQQGGAYNQ
jgi:hypothetical protein